MCGLREELLLRADLSVLCEALLADLLEHSAIASEYVFISFNAANMCLIHNPPPHQPYPPTSKFFQLKNRNSPSQRCHCQFRRDEFEMSDKITNN